MRCTETMSATDNPLNVESGLTAAAAREADPPEPDPRRPMGSADGGRGDEEEPQPHPFLTVYDLIDRSE
jgi:hypothetical protein